MPLIASREARCTRHGSSELWIKLPNLYTSNGKQKRADANRCGPFTKIGVDAVTTAARTQPLTDKPTDVLAATIIIVSPNRRPCPCGKSGGTRWREKERRLWLPRISLQFVSGLSTKVCRLPLAAMLCNPPCLPSDQSAIVNRAAFDVAKAIGAA